MATTTKTQAGPPSAARQRLLDTASRLFYSEGIQAVGVDRLVAEAEITKATFYRHFSTKDELVVGYLRAQDDTVRGIVAGQTTGLSGVAALTEIFAGMAGHACGPGFRGCPFINAAAEYPDATHPVRQVIAVHRAWFRSMLVTRLGEAGHPRCDTAAATLLLLRDGVMVGSYLDDPETVRATVVAAVSDVVSV